MNGVKICHAAQEARYPSRPIRIMVPAGAGGSLGQEIRAIAPFLEKNLGVQMPIDYVTGAEGMICYNKFYNEKPDGNTIAYFNLSSAISLELSRETAKYVVKNLSPVAIWNVKPHTLAVNSDSWKTFDEFLKDAKQRRVSLAATGGSADLQGRLLEAAMGIKFNWVPYESSAEGIAAVAGKHVEAIMTFTISPRPMIRAGKLRALAVFSTRPDPILPGVPNFKDLKHPEVPLLLIYGTVAAPPKTSNEILTTLEKGIKNAVADPEFNKLAETVGIDVDFKPTSELKKVIADSYELLNKHKQFIK